MSGGWLRLVANGRWLAVPGGQWLVAGYAWWPMAGGRWLVAPTPKLLGSAAIELIMKQDFLQMLNEDGSTTLSNKTGTSQADILTE